MGALPQDLLDAAKAVLDYSYSPYSHFKVACALRAENGEIFAGCNVENAAYSVTMCAEVSALGAMVSQGQLKIAEVLVLFDADKPASPCGACRQRLAELSSADTIVHMCSLSGKHDSMSMAALLPNAFEL